MNKLIFFILPIFLLIKCPGQDDPVDSTLFIVNNSQEDIIYQIEFNAPTDTSLFTFSFPLLPENTEHRIIPSSSEVSLSEGFIKFLTDKPEEVLMLYLFSRDTIEQVPWERIRDEYLVLRRYDLTLEDLEALDWTVEYP